MFSMTGPIFAFACKTVQSLHNPNNTNSLKKSIILKYGIVSTNIAEIDRSILLKTVVLYHPTTNADVFLLSSKPAV